MNDAAKRRATLLQKLVHFLTAFTLLMKALSKLDHPEGKGAVIAFFLLAAIYIVAITLLHDHLHAHARTLEASVYAIEAIGTGLLAFLYSAEGKKGLPWVFAAAAIGFVIAFVIRLTKRSAAHA